MQYTTVFSLLGLCSGLSSCRAHLYNTVASHGELSLLNVTASILASDCSLDLHLEPSVGQVALKHQQGCDTPQVCEQYGYYRCRIHKPRPLLITTTTPGHTHLYSHTHVCRDQSKTACYGPGVFRASPTSTSLSESIHQYIIVQSIHIISAYQEVPQYFLKGNFSKEFYTFYCEFAM